ncbi:MAG: winged helix DNA-binding domain-containing protein, partial [Actinomycetota bacterium]|nr:winged helix DNA-binding domain-containing protein [Actinomycetota bacterium]
LWALRGTLHLVVAEDAGWLLGLLAPALLRAAPRRLRQLGVADGDGERAVAVIERALADRGPLPRAALAEHLRAVGIETAGQATIHLVRLAALHGVCLAGPDDTFVLWRDWLGEPPRALDRDVALAELARRHHAAHAPAGPEDLAAWSGLGVRESRRAWTLAPDSRAHMPTLRSDTVRLLPAWDELLLGWRDRTPVLPSAHARKVQRGGGILRPTVLHGGTIVATWRPERTPGRITVTVEPFTTDLDAIVTASLTAAVRQTASFEDRQPTLEISGSPP